MEIIRETSSFYLLHKPAGVNFHSEDGETGFFAQFEEERGEKLWPVHRLDKVTSGLILVAKSAEVARDIGKLFEENGIEKWYLALSDRKPKKKQGAVIGDMCRSRRSTWMLLKSRENPARTQFFSWGTASGIRLFLVRPRTGKTHQIRVALKSLGAPILGDPLYHAPHETPVDRTYLHAYALRFTLYGEPFTFVHPPTDGALWLDLSGWGAESIGSPWDLPWPGIG